MKQFWLNLAEAALLLAALFCTLPYMPSNEMERLPLLPMGAFAIILFAASQASRSAASPLRGIEFEIDATPKRHRDQASRRAPILFGSEACPPDSGM
jgi:hypothetical protein